MKIKKIEAGFSASNTYLVFDEKSNEGVIVDPGDMGQLILRECSGIDIKYIIITHAHFDHIGALSYVAENTGAKVVIHTVEAPSLTDAAFNLAHLAGVSENKRNADVTVSDGDEMMVGDVKLKFIHTPGHTKGGMCILVGEKDLITGDTLFCGSVGRTDFPGGNYDVLIESIEKITQLGDDVTIYPGHGEESTIGFEKKTNPFIKHD